MSEKLIALLVAFIASGGYAAVALLMAIQSACIPIPSEVIMPLAGYALGSRIPGIDRYLLPVIAVVVAVSLIPVGLELWRQRRDRHATPDPEKTS